MRQKLAAGWRDSRGAGFVEYLVLAGAVALLAFGAYRLFASGVGHKADAQAQTVRSLSSPAAAAAEPAAEATNAEPVAASEQPAKPESRSEVESVAAFDSAGSADSEAPALSLGVIVLFAAGVLLVGGIVIATLARPRHAAADADSAEASQ